MYRQPIDKQEAKEKELENIEAKNLPNQKLQERVRKKLFISYLPTIVLVITIAIIIYENISKKERFLSFIGLGFAFLSLALVQFYNYKDAKKKMSLIIGGIYTILAILIILKVMIN